MWPRITVVTPSYNQAAFIEETIESVLGQDYPNLEYIILDGGSTDGSTEIIRRYASSLAYWASEPDRGQTHAINKGLSRATGEIFAYLNSDDVYAPGALHAVAEAFTRNPTADVVFGKCAYIDANSAELETRQARFGDLDEYLAIWKLMARGLSLTQPEVFCKTAAVRSAGGFREDLRFVMDFEMWIRLMELGSVFHPTDTVLARFRVYPEQKSTSAGEELYSVVRSTYERLVARNPERASNAFLAELTAERLHWLYQASYAAGRGGSRSRGLALCLKALRIDPAQLARYEFWRTLADPVVQLARSR